MVRYTLEDVRELLDELRHEEHPDECDPYGIALKRACECISLIENLSNEIEGL